MELSFDSGVKEYTIRGVNGIVTVYFNPADVNFAKKAYKTFDDLRKKQETRAKTLEKDIPDDELFDMVDSLDKEMRSIINDLFGQDIADTLFGSVNAYVDDYSTNLSISATIATDKPQLDGAVAAGKKMTGVVGYEVPKNWEEIEIRFTPDFWSGNEIEFIANK